MHRFFICSIFVNKNTRIMYVYKRTEFSPYELYTVGYYEPNGSWQPESDHSTKEEAANRVSFLNGN